MTMLGLDDNLRGLMGEDLVKAQARYHRECFGVPLTPNREMQRDAIIAILGELDELQQSLALLPWKSAPLDLANAKEEVVDLLFFVLELANLVGITSEVELRFLYFEKMKRNYTRIGRDHVRHGGVS